MDKNNLGAGGITSCHKSYLISCIWHMRKAGHSNGSRRTSTVPPMSINKAKEMGVPLILDVTQTNIRKRYYKFLASRPSPFCNITRHNSLLNLAYSANTILFFIYFTFMRQKQFDPWLWSPRGRIRKHWKSNNLWSNKMKGNLKKMPEVNIHHLPTLRIRHPRVLQLFCRHQSSHAHIEYPYLASPA